MYEITYEKMLSILLNKVKYEAQIKQIERDMMVPPG